MKKLLLAVFTLSVISVNAQDGKSSGTNFEIGANIGTGTKKGYTTTYGVDAQVNIPAATGFKVTASAGYQNANFKMDYGAPIGTIKADFGFIPLYAGALFNLSSKLMAHGQLGYAFSTASGGGGHFSYSPSLLYLLSTNLSLALKYMSIDTYNAVLLRIAYSLGK